MSDQPMNMNLDSMAIMIREGSKVALGLIDAPAPVLQPALSKPPKLTVIEGGRAGEPPRFRRRRLL